jgi:hypothetical protein
MVLPDECEEIVGRPSSAGGSAAGAWGEVSAGNDEDEEDDDDATATAASSSSLSGLAIRRPPSDCDRLKSPFMALAIIHEAKASDRAKTAYNKGRTAVEGGVERVGSSTT